MKKTFPIVSIILAAILVSEAAFAVSPPACPPQGHGSCTAASFAHQPPPPAPGMMLLMNYLQVNVLSELTGFTQENVRMMLACAPMPAILDQYGIDPKDFHAAMDRQIGALVNQAAAGNVISKKQAEDIRKRMALKRTQLHEE